MENETQESTILAVCRNCNHKFLTTVKLIDSLCPGCGTQGACDYAQEEIMPDILNEAFQVINGDRQDSYGKPEDSFQIISEFWSTYLKHRFKIDILLTPLDTVHLMSLFKHARLLGQAPVRDNYRDAVGYLAIAADRLS